MGCRIWGRAYDEKELWILEADAIADDVAMDGQARKQVDVRQL
jgi:hypothetical protein